MRRPLLLLALVVVAALAAACTSSSAPAWTYAAPTSPPPSQPAASGSAAPGSAAPASAGPSTAPASAPAGGGGAGTPVQISAQGVQFEQKDVTAPAGTAFTIHFDNKDAGQPHNVAIKDGSGAEIFKGDIVTGPAAVDYQVPALTAGSYTFVCDVHPNMTGTLTVK
jgi:plastocyanin